MISDFKKGINRKQSNNIRKKHGDISKNGKIFFGNQCEYYSHINAYAKGKFVKNIVSKILGKKIFLFNEQLVNKNPNTPSSFSWHQDSGYVGHDHKAYLSIWIALCDTNENNGALRILPINLEREAKIEEHFWSEQSSDLSMKVQEEKSISCTIEEGGLVLFSSRTPHASFPNKSNKNRPAYLCQYSSEPIIPPPGSNKKFRAELI